jgi:hypothetical protein
MTPDRDLEIHWSTSDPQALAARLRGAGFEFDADHVLRLPSATIRLRRGTAPADRLEVDEAPFSGTVIDPLEPGDDPGAIEDVVAIGWATVDRERFLADASGGPDVDLPPDTHLGAIAVRHGAAGPGPQVIVLEPYTEGRLVASLVRSDEGPAAVYFAAGGGLDAFVAEAHRRGTPVSGIGTGPLGPSVVVLGGPRWGPHLLVVDRPSGGTIET